MRLRVKYSELFPLGGGCSFGSPWRRSFKVMVTESNVTKRGEGFSGTPIKDTWIKTRWGVESGEGGEDG